ncbi:hypothetical protein ACQY0O_004300 [Thecaphora frezii]
MPADLPPKPPFAGCPSQSSPDASGVPQRPTAAETAALPPRPAAVAVQAIKQDDEEEAEEGEITEEGEIVEGPTPKPPVQEPKATAPESSPPVITPALLHQLRPHRTSTDTTPLGTATARKLSESKDEAIAAPPTRSPDNRPEIDPAPAQSTPAFSVTVSAKPTLREGPSTPAETQSLTQDTAGVAEPAADKAPPASSTEPSVPTSAASVGTAAAPPPVVEEPYTPPIKPASTALVGATNADAPAENGPAHPPTMEATALIPEESGLVQSAPTKDTQETHAPTEPTGTSTAADTHSAVKPTDPPKEPSAPANPSTATLEEPSASVEEQAAPVAIAPDAKPAAANTAIKPEVDATNQDLTLFAETTAQQQKASPVIEEQPSASDKTRPVDAPAEPLTEDVEMKVDEAKAPTPPVEDAFAQKPSAEIRDVQMDNFDGVQTPDPASDPAESPQEQRDEEGNAKAPDQEALGGPEQIEGGRNFEPDHHASEGLIRTPEAVSVAFPAPVEKPVTEDTVKADDKSDSAAAAEQAASVEKETAAPVDTVEADTTKKSLDAAAPARVEEQAPQVEKEVSSETVAPVEAKDKEPRVEQAHKLPLATAPGPTPTPAPTQRDAGPTDPKPKVSPSPVRTTVQQVASDRSGTLQASALKQPQQQQQQPPRPQPQPQTLQHQHSQPKHSQQQPLHLRQEVSRPSHPPQTEVEPPERERKSRSHPSRPSMPERDRNSGSDRHSNRERRKEQESERERYEREREREREQERERERMRESERDRELLIARENEEARLIWLSLPGNDHPQYYTDTDSDSCLGDGGVGMYGTDEEDKDLDPPRPLTLQEYYPPPSTSSAFATGTKRKSPGYPLVDPYGRNHRDTDYNRVHTKRRTNAGDVSPDLDVTIPALALDAQGRGMINLDDFDVPDSSIRGEPEERPLFNRDATFGHYEANDDDDVSLATSDSDEEASKIAQERKRRHSNRIGNRGNKLSRAKGVRWHRRGKLGGWTEARMEKEVGDRVRHRIEALQKDNIRALVAAMPAEDKDMLNQFPALRDGLLPAEAQSNGSVTKDARGRLLPSDLSEAARLDAQLDLGPGAAPTLADAPYSDGPEHLTSTLLAPTLLKPAVTARQLLTSHTLRHTFRNPHIGALGKTALDLIESEGVLGRAIGRCWSSMERGGWNVDPEPKVSSADDMEVDDADANNDANEAEVGEANGVRDEHDVLASLTENPALQHLDDLFVTKGGLAIPKLDDAGEPIYEAVDPNDPSNPPGPDGRPVEARLATTLLPAMEQRAVVLAALECLHELAADSREYVERLEEVRSRLATIKRRRAQVWAAVREWAIQKEENGEGETSFHPADAIAAAAAAAAAAEAAATSSTQVAKEAGAASQPESASAAATVPTATSTPSAAGSKTTKPNAPANASATPTASTTSTPATATAAGTGTGTGKTRKKAKATTAVPASTSAGTVTDGSRIASPAAPSGRSTVTSALAGATFA